MNVWENAVITNKGIALLSKLIAGNTLEITKAETGTGYVTPGLLIAQTAVKDAFQELSFRAAEYPEEGKCKLPCFLENSGVAAGYTAKQIGIYAKDPDEGEILFFIAQAQSDKGTEIPSETEMPGYSAEWTFYFTYGQADSVSVTVDPSNVISRGEMESYVRDQIAAIEINLESDVSGTLPVSKGGTGATTIEDSGLVPIVNVTSEDGITYTGTIDGLTELKTGMTISVVPNRGAAGNRTVLNINGLGEHGLVRPMSSGEINSFLTADHVRKNIPIVCTYTGGWWSAHFTKPSATDLDGTVSISNGGTGATTAEEARENLGVASKDLSNIDNDTFKSKVESSGVSLDVTPETFKGILPISKGGTGASTMENSGLVPIVNLTSIPSNEGVEFTGTIAGLTELTNGLTITVIPDHDVLGSMYIDINNLGLTEVFVPCGSGDFLDVIGGTFVRKGEPIQLTCTYNDIEQFIWRARLDLVSINEEDKLLALGAAPAYSYGTEDLTAGTSVLGTGKLYFVYE